MDSITYLKDMIFKHKSFDLAGKELRVTGTIQYSEAEMMMSIIQSRGYKYCMETGVAYGASTIAICTALSRLDFSGTKCKLFGVDPCQFTDYGGAAVAALKICGLDHLFELLEGPSHIMLPKLIERGQKIDFAFVDGWHTFDYTLLDVFYADKLLRPGGILAMHDMYMKSKQKAFRWLLAHRHYRVVALGQDNLMRRVAASLIWLLRGRADVARSRLMGVRGLLVAEKVDHWEPSYDFFSNF